MKTSRYTVTQILSILRQTKGAIPEAPLLPGAWRGVIAQTQAIEGSDAQIK